MDTSEFNTLVKRHNLKGASVDAARRVLVDGLSAYAAAKELGITESTISRALAKLKRPLCPCCQQPLPQDQY